MTKLKIEDTWLEPSTLIRDEGIWNNAGSDIKKVVFGGYKELADNGFADFGVTGPSYDDSVLVNYQLGPEGQRVPQAIRGVIIYRKNEWNNTLWIMLSYVHPDFRRQGVYKQLYNKLKLIAKQLEVEAIGSAVHPNNNDMHLTMRAVGRTVNAIEYVDKI